MWIDKNNSLFALEAVYKVQVFASNSELLLQFFLLQLRAGAPETANFWNQVTECKFFETTTFFPAV